VAVAEDWGGDYLLPGLVELHTDNIEKHLAPRPGVLWNPDAAILVHDAQVATAGITTVFDALGIGSRGGVGVRGKELQTNCASGSQAVDCCASTTSCICDAKWRQRTCSTYSTGWFRIRCCALSP
jgi:alpha-D-ribose 1-methylphosphonate 5-triphosphate diphosphatase PhnM